MNTLRPASVRPSSRRAVGSARRGVTLPFVCIMLTALLGGMALAVDMGRVYLTTSEAQAAADAAALAGARFLQQYPGYYGSINTTYGIAAIAPGNDVAGSNSHVLSSDIQPVTYDPVANSVTATSWSSSTSAVTVTVRATPPYVFGRALGITPPSVSRRATAWIANMNGASCVRPFALPYTRFLEAGMHNNHQDSTWTKQGVAPDYSYGGIASLQPIYPYNNVPRGRTYTAIPQWEKENVIDTVSTGSYHAVTGRWTPANFAGGGIPSYQDYVAGAPKSAQCQAAVAQVGITVPPLPGYDNPSSTSKQSLLNAMSYAVGVLCHRSGNDTTDAHCYDSTGVVGMRARVFLTDSVGGGSAGYQLNTREVTMVRVMCYFRHTVDHCDPAYIRDENSPTATTPTVSWQMLGRASSGYPPGSITVLLDGPTNVDATSDLIFGNKPSITQRIYLVR